MSTTPQLSGPPAPGRTEPGPFPAEAGDGDERHSFLDAWAKLMRSIGTDLQGGLHRSSEARRRMRRAR